ncbi:conserved hypothetical protein [Theileria orientalis strain Shintoku]|uniref:Uncharacterized protein n=1 Tax=Theileria orientalis strain Shintoku TaxID=869250 RepID=J4DPV2_THEOR|nr:conserved hypothetical protein [Theileria orientalis strain Shintoku]BAM41349.1 conserved hypothetical protein [Theileria orientalis strain Shintoku]|eukprot:XP_009691650.1 conserved hypothetical protein [Theileria orientalis strain Shintoku]
MFKYSGICYKSSKMKKKLKKKRSSGILSNKYLECTFSYYILKMKSILIFGVALIVKAAFSDLLSPPEPFSIESLGALKNESNTKAKKANKKGSNIPSKASKDKKGNGSSGDSNSDSNLVEVPQNILEAVKQDEKSLRGGNTEIKPETESESGDDSKGDKSQTEKMKKDPILESIEEAEKQLAEAFTAVRSKIMSMGGNQKPIKVDCGTTRVRVVCSKKGEPEEADEENPEEKSQGETETERGESEEAGEGEEE